MVDIIFPADPKGVYNIYSPYKFDAADKEWKRPRADVWELDLPRTEINIIKEGLVTAMKFAPNGPIDIPMGVMFAGQRRNFPVVGNFASSCTMAIFYQGERVVAVHKNPTMTWEDIIRASGLNFEQPITLYTDNVEADREAINHELANSVSIQKIPVLRLINGGEFGRNSDFNVREQREYRHGEANTGIGGFEIGRGEIGGGEIGNGRIDIDMRGGEIGGRPAGLGEIGGRIGDGGIGDGGIGEGGMGGRIR